MEFRGKLNELSFDREGNNRITLTSFSDLRNEFDDLADKEVTVIIKPYRKKRSLSANAYCWVLIDKIAESTGISKEEVYREAIKDIGGVSSTICIQKGAAKIMSDIWKRKGLGWQVDELDSKIDGCVCLTLYYGSSCYDTKQMQALIDHVVQDAKSLGIETLTPDELERMVGRWGNGEEHHDN